MEVGLVALALGSAVCFALALVLTQFGLRSVDPLTGAAISIPTTAAIFLSLAPLTIGSQGWDASAAAIFALAGLFFPAAVTLLTFAANRHLGPSIAGALGNLSPLFAVLLAALLLDEVPRGGQLAGLAAISAGVVLLLLGRPRAGLAGASWIYLLPFAAALVRGIVQPLVKLGLAAWPSPFAAATIGYLVSAAVVVTGYLVQRPGNRAPGRDWPWFIGVGVLNGSAVLALYAALARGPVAVVAPLVACHPLATVALDRVICRNPKLGRTALTGITLTVAGVALILSS